MRVLVIGGIARSLVNFRGPLIRAMHDLGHDVLACAGEPDPQAIATMSDWGVRCEPIPLSRAGVRPWEDLHTCRQLWLLMRQFQPDLVLSYTIKPVIWGGIAARLASIPNVYSLVTGLGYAFMESKTTDRKQQTTNPVTQEMPSETRRASPDILPRTATSSKQRVAGWMARRLYKISLKYSRKVFFQNPDDRREFVKAGLVHHDKTVVVSGSGVDVQHFAPALLPERHVFLLIARLLTDKGVREYVQAARELKNADASISPSQRRSTAWSQSSLSKAVPNKEPETKHTLSTAHCLLAGNLDPNPASISKAELDAWVKSGNIEHLGYLDDVRPAYERCSVYVLPSYREGTPRTVLEAMATGRPIITTDAPGCRETVRQRSEPLASDTEGRASLQNGFVIKGKLKIGANGILVPPRDAPSVADAMRFFIEHPEQIAVMGRESRSYAEERYDVHKVNAVMLREMGM